jgi:hypothetical protein
MDMVLFNGQVLPHLFLAVTALQAHQAVGLSVLLRLILKYVSQLRVQVVIQVVIFNYYIYQSKLQLWK